MTRISKESELYDEELFPLIDFFNAISTSSFVKAMKYFSEGKSQVIEYNACYFSTDVEPGEEVFEGVKFSEEYLQEEVVVSYDLVYKYMKMLSAQFVKEQPESLSEISLYLENFAAKFEVRNKK